MNFLIHLKHWQIFFLMFGVPIATIFILDESVMDVIAPYLLSLMAFLYLGWFLSVGRMLNARLPNSIKMNLNLFYLVLSIPFLYFIVVFAMLKNLGQTPDSVPFGFFYIIFPLHLLSFGAVVYCSYFNAKSMKAVEYEKSVALTEYLGELFLFCFLPVGIWILQPKVNKLSKKSRIRRN